MNQIYYPHDKSEDSVLPKLLVQISLHTVDPTFNFDEISLRPAYLHTHYSKRPTPIAVASVAHLDGRWYAFSTPCCCLVLGITQMHDKCILHELAKWRGGCNRLASHTSPTGPHKCSFASVLVFPRHQQLQEERKR